MEHETYTHKHPLSPPADPPLSPSQLPQLSPAPRPRSPPHSLPPPQRHEVDLQMMFLSTKVWFGIGFPLLGWGFYWFIYFLNQEDTQITQFPKEFLGQPDHEFHCGRTDVHFRKELRISLRLINLSTMIS